MGVSVTEIANGSIGLVHCDEGLSFDAVIKAPAAYIQGQSSNQKCNLVANYLVNLYDPNNENLKKSNYFQAICLTNSSTI